MKFDFHKTQAALGLIVSAALLTSVSVFSATNEGPYYLTQEQANYEYMNALHESDLTAKQMLVQMQSLDAAKAHVQEAQMAGHSAQIHAALDERETKLARTMSQMSGVSQEDITAMHESGMSWGQLGQEIGLKTQGNSQHSGSSVTDSMMNSNQKTRQGQKINQTRTMSSGISETHSNDSMGISSPPVMAIDMGEPNISGEGMNSAMPISQQVHMAETENGSMSLYNSVRLTPMPQDKSSIKSMNSDQNQNLFHNASGQQHETMQEIGISRTEMDAATARNVMNGGVSGHGTNVNSDLSHRSGSMMNGVGGLENGMPSDHGANSGEGSGGMGGNSGSGMGDSGASMGGSGSNGSGGGGMGGSESGGGGMGGGGGMM